jgi:FkbM family methyltransferase
MKTKLIGLIHRVYSLIYGNVDYPSTRLRHPYQANFDRWFADRGDRTLRLNYGLTPSSLVFDVGGYEGQWASDIFAKYGCAIHIFEPVESFAKALTARFASQPRITINNFGLAASSRREMISLADNASSLFIDAKNKQLIHLVAASEYFMTHDISAIALMKINIEGGEFELLEHLIDTRLIRQIANIQIQFHHFVADAEYRMRQIQDRLCETHRVTWQYPFVWENWERQ